MDRLLEFIQEYEGWKPTPYRCPAGKWTIGWGHNLEARGAPGWLCKCLLDKTPITKDQGYELLTNEVAESIGHAKRLVSNFWTHSTARQAVIVDMIFNLGPAGFAEFGGTIKHIEARQYEEAARHMEGTLWYRQVKLRAVRNCKIMRSGEYA